MKLKDKVVIVTGASSGIGEATAIALAKEGAKVVLAARRMNRIADIEKKIVAEGGEAMSVSVDVSIKDQVDTLVQQTKERFGRVDILVNNAGVMLLSYLDKSKVEEWEKMIDVNIKGVLYGINAVLPIFREQTSGHFINVSSVAGHGVFPSSAVYSGTKYAVRAISEGIRMELADMPGICSTIISPGAVATELTTHITDQDVMNMFSKRKMVPLKSEDIANAIVYAATQPEYVDVNEILIRPSGQRP